MVRCRNCGAVPDSGPSSAAPAASEAAELLQWEEDEWAAVDSTALDSTAEPKTSPDPPVERREAVAASPSTAVAADAVRSPSATQPHRPKARQPITVGLAAGLVLAGIVVGGWFATARLWAPPGRIAVLKGPANHLACVTFSRDGTLVLAGATSGDVVAWPISSGQARPLARALDEPVLALAASPTDMVVAGGAGRQLVAWPNLGDPDQKFRTMTGFSAPITAVALHPRKPLMAVGTADGQLFVFGGPKPQKGPAGHFGGVRALAFSPGGTILASAGTDGTILWRHAETLAVETTSKVHAAEIGALAFSDDGRRLVSGDWNGTIRVFDTSRREVTTELRQPDGISGGAIVGDRLVTAGWDGRLRFWSLTSGQLEHEIDTGAPLHHMAVHPQAGLIATVSGTAAVTLWKLAGH